ncbi:MAG: acyl-coenzyme thioesterase 13 [Pseudonocardiales bacterium]|nr:acyl-coenzyme thioesterase 13 [Pseudonocardiales bacterium]
MNLDDLRTALSTPREHGWTVPGIEAVSLEHGHVVIRVEVTLDLVNVAKTLHGGAAATLVDIVGTLAIITADEHNRFGASTDLNVSWLAPVPLGDYALVDAHVLKSGRSLAFVTVDIRRESDDTLCVQGRMTKAMGPPPAPAAT